MSAAPVSARHARFLKNVAWNWAGVAVSIASGILLSPYIIRRRGNEGYGIWALAFALIEYYWLLDLGFRSAAIKYSAHYHALGRPQKVNEIVNTSLLYFSVVGALLFAATAALASPVTSAFQVSPAARPAFRFLVLVVGLSWSVGIVFNVFSACLEGLQRFDVAGKIWVCTSSLRAGGLALVLWLGYGLEHMGVVVVASQFLGYVLNFVALRRVFPELRLSLSQARLPVFREMAAYALHSFVATVSSQVLNQAAPVVIGYHRPAAFVGYYNLPVRLLQVMVEAVARVSVVSSSSAAHLSAATNLPPVAVLGVYANRYCLALFGLLAVFLSTYPAEILTAYISAAFARHSAPLLPVLTLAFTLAIAGQFNSSAILFGLGKHRGYARTLFAEAVALVALGLFVVPRYGIFGMAVVASVLMILNRACLTPLFLCRSLATPWIHYMRAIYLRPLVCALPALALALALRASILPGRSLWELLAAAALIGLAYYPAAFFVCVEPDHRKMLWSLLARRFARP